MSYTKYVSRSSPEFDGLAELIYQSSKDSDHKPSLSPKSPYAIHIKTKVKENWNITLGDYDSVKAHTPVDFGSEENYCWFMLRWS